MLNVELANDLDVGMTGRLDMKMSVRPSNKARISIRC